MSTTKKDYEAIAAILWRHADNSEDEATRAAVYAVADDLSDHFAETNPAFSHSRFEAAVRGRQ